jgi:hypothetical protein
VASDVTLADAITALATGTYVVTRPGPGAWATGLFVEDAPSTFSIVASVQPTSGKDLARLPEGERSAARITLFTVTELRTASIAGKTLSDRVAYRGETYEVEHVDAWESGGFYKAIARKVEL